MTVTVYLVTNLVNNKKYVGFTKLPIEKRLKGHISSSRNGSNCALHKAISKHGIDIAKKAGFLNEKGITG
jgi:hypothetical protein